MINNESIKKNISRLRYLAKVSQTEMADRLKVNRNTYRNIEKGKTRFINEHLVPIARELGVDSEELVIGYRPGDPEADPILQEKMVEYDNQVSSIIESYERKTEDDKKRIIRLEKRIAELESSLRDKADLISFLKEKNADLEKIIGKM